MNQETSMPPQISLLTSDTELTAAFPAFLALRPHLDLARFIAQVRRQQAQGYQIVAVSDGDEVMAVAGFRVAEFLAWGKVLYVDDLSTLPAHRGCGHAGALLEWLFVRAREQGCDAVHLDSGYGRHDAHRLYLNKGFNLASHHFSRQVV
jgi:GNAT superfamily N-acetyltransferase